MNLKTIDIDLRHKRTKMYRGILIDLRILSRYPIRYRLVRYVDLINLFKKLHVWYFDTDAGMYLSDSSRKSLFHLKEAIIEQLELQLSNSESSRKKFYRIRKLFNQIIQIFFHKRQNSKRHYVVIQLLDEKLFADQDFEQQKNNPKYHLLDLLQDDQLKKIVDKAHKFRESIAKDIGGRAEAQIR
jgi:hypothetical protein